MNENVDVSFLNEELGELWVISFDIALATLLAVFIVAKLTIVNYDEHSKINRLTLLPYYFTLAYAVLTISQYCF